MSTPKLLYSAFDRACLFYSDRIALVEGDRTCTYDEMGRWSNRVAHGLIELGVEHGDRVGLLMPNCLEFVPTQQGIWKTGAAVVQMQALASVDDWVHVITTSGATTLVYHDRFDHAMEKIRTACPTLSRVIRLSTAEGRTTPDGVHEYSAVFGGQPEHAPEVDVQPDDLGFVMFTSGSTGLPKGARHTHRSWVQTAIVAGMEIGDIRPGEIFAHGAPLTHYSQIFLQPTFMRGGTNVILPGLDVETIFAAVARHGVTAIALVPTVIYMMLDHPASASTDLSTLRTIAYAGSPIAPDRLSEAIVVFGEVFVQAYGGTEPGFMTCLRKEDHRIGDGVDTARLSSAGRAMFHVNVSIQDEDDQLLPVGEVGEICTQQAGSMAGYLDASVDAEAIRGGWVHSGDIGYLDASGYLYIVDRKKDMVVTGGFNVFPRQVEDILMTHDDVTMCAVIGVPDDKWGEAVKAVVVRREGATVDAAELQALVKARKGAVWAPKTVDFVDALPVNASGKLDKRTLKAPYWAGQQRSVH
jgi:acyl-CoA synthetase (AMP-forming)/AMP-acid ligase II